MVRDSMTEDIMRTRLLLGDTLVLRSVTGASFSYATWEAASYYAVDKYIYRTPRCWVDCEQEMLK